MTPAPIDPLYLLQRDRERARHRAYKTLRKLRERNARSRAAEQAATRVHLGELRYGEI